jgi:hypothetical protein
MTGVRKVYLLVLAGLLAGCSQARFVHSDQWGGVIAIPNNSNQWPTYYQDQAKEMMKRQCPQGYVIEGEDEVVTGQTSQVYTEGNRDSVASAVFGVGEERKTISQHNITEWRIRYRAKDAPESVKPLKLTFPGQPPPPAAPGQEQAVASNGGLPPEPVPVPR